MTALHRMNLPSGGKGVCQVKGYKKKERNADPGSYDQEVDNMNEKKEALRLEILKDIEKNSRVDLGELAVRLGAEETDVANEMAEMEKEKIICGYHTLIDWDRAGVEMVTALIEVRVTPQRDRGFDRIAERIYNYPEVYAVYLISGSYDLLVTLEGKTLKEVSRFVSESFLPLTRSSVLPPISSLRNTKTTARSWCLKKGSEGCCDAVLRNPLSKKIVDIQPSGIRKFFDVANEMEDAISLGVGEPDFDTPWRIREEGIFSLERGRDILYIQCRTARN